MRSAEELWAWLMMVPASALIAEHFVTKEDKSAFSLNAKMDDNKLSLNRK